MIATTSKLKQFCNFISNVKVGKPLPSPMSREMYKKFTEWQFANKYPQLLSIRSGRNHCMARVR